MRPPPPLPVPWGAKTAGFPLALMLPVPENVPQWM